MTKQEIQDKIEAIIASPNSEIQKYGNLISITGRDGQGFRSLNIERKEFIFWNPYTVSCGLDPIPVKSARKLWHQAMQVYKKRRAAESFKRLDYLHAAIINTLNIKH